MIQIKEEALLNDIEIIFENDHFKCMIDPDHAYIICEVLVSYVPVESFIENFNQMVKPIKKYKIKKFIFDKRALRAFNQPTMEWYFIEWKTKLMNLGLKTHRKILPQEEWFKKCVEAGKDSILKTNPNFPVNELDIQYFNSIEECINN